MKKTLIFLMSVVLLLSVMTAQAFAADAPTVTVTTSGDVAAGEMLVVTVLLNDAEAVKGVAVEPQYDASAFELVSGTWLISGLIEDFSAEAGDGVIAFASARDLDGAIFSYTLKAKRNAQAGSKSVGCTVVVSDSGNQNTTLSGSTTVYIPCSYGDVNGDGQIDTTDAKLIMQYDLGVLDETALALSVADVNGDGQIDTTDAKLIMQYDLGLISQFPDKQ